MACILDKFRIPQLTQQSCSQHVCRLILDNIGENKWQADAAQLNKRVILPAIQTNVIFIQKYPWGRVLH